MTAFSLRLALLGLLATASTLSAQLVNDSSDFTNWYQGNADGVLNKAGANLVWTPAAPANNSTNQIIGRSFTETTLAVGQTITFSFDWTQSVASAAIIRVGLANRSASAIAADGWNNTAGGTYDSYYTFIRDNDATGNTPRKESGTFGTTSGILVGGANLTGGNTTLFDLVQNGTVTYNVTYSVTLTSGTSISSSFIIMEGATQRFNVSGTDSSGIISTFDTAAIRVAGGTGTFDNILVTTSSIPEPSTYAALAGLGVLGMAALRRRRN